MEFWDERKSSAGDVFLPVCNEPLELLKNTWRHVGKLQYPPSKIESYVPDDGANEEVRLSAERFGFSYFVDQKPGTSLVLPTCSRRAYAPSQCVSPWPQQS